MNLQKSDNDNNSIPTERNGGHASDGSQLLAFDMSSNTLTKGGDRFGNSGHAETGEPERTDKPLQGFQMPSQSFYILNTKAGMYPYNDQSVNRIQGFPIPIEYSHPSVGGWTKDNDPNQTGFPEPTYYRGHPVIDAVQYHLAWEYGAPLQQKDVMYGEAELIIPWEVPGSGVLPPWGDTDPYANWFENEMTARQESERLCQILQLANSTVREKEEELAAYQGESADRVWEKLAVRKAETKKRLRENREHTWKMGAQSLDENEVEEWVRLNQELVDYMDASMKMLQHENASRQRIRNFSDDGEVEKQDKKSTSTESNA